MLTAIGDIISPPTTRARGGAPVRRHSHTAGRCEGIFWRRTDRQEVRRAVLAAERYELATRQPGDRNGALGSVALEILRYLANLIDYRTGRLDPSLETMMRKLRRSRDAIVRALAALRRHGFIDWLRRYVPTGRDHGPQVQQTSNAYRLSAPQRALRLLGRLGVPVPMPDDFEHARMARTPVLDAYRRSLDLDELPLFAGDPDDPLTQSLVALGRAMKERRERESAKQTESLSRKIQ